ncbi:hypothetical protein M569_04588, partial [Genlisea aurea]
RKEVLDLKKARASAIRAALSIDDHLSDFSNFRCYRRNGLHMYLKSGTGAKLTSRTKASIKSLLKRNMEGPYGSEWPYEERIKHREMVSVEARYIFVYEFSEEKPKEVLESEGLKKTSTRDETIAAFVHYRFVFEEEVPVVYVYELQLEQRVQGKGLGQFLMQLIELIAQKNGMGAVMLTVQRTNLLAMRFYIDKLQYQVSSISPSRF